MTDEIVCVSVFAGIGGLEWGGDAQGIRTVVQIEKDEQCRRVLARRFPDAVQFGDVSEVEVEDVRRIVGGRRTAFAGGFPCQDVSVAGGRSGMAGGRSSLYRELLRLADGLDPDWLVVENVPGLLSADVDPNANGGAACRQRAAGGSDDEDEDAELEPVRCDHEPLWHGRPHGYGPGTAFAVVLGDITGYRPPVPERGWRSSGVCSGPRRTVAWRVLDARHFGVAQRRRRVFLVAHPRDRAAPAAVLLECEGVRGDSPEGEPPRPRFATRVARADVQAGVAGADGDGADLAGSDLGLDAGQRLSVTLGSLTGGQRQDLDGMTYVPLAEGAAAAREAGPGYWMADDQAGPLTHRDYKDGPRTIIGAGVDLRNGEVTGDVAMTVQAGGQPGERGRSINSIPHVLDEPDEARPTLAYEVDKERGRPNDEGIKVTETTDPAERTDRGLRIVQPATFRKSRRAADPTDDETWVEDDRANTLNTFDGGDARATEIVVEPVPAADPQPGALVRRLTPLECERLQGCPEDGWTDVDDTSDSARYRQLGNAVAFPVAAWVWWRLAAYENGWRPA